MRIDLTSWQRIHILTVPAWVYICQLRSMIFVLSCTRDFSSGLRVPEASRLSNVMLTSTERKGGTAGEHVMEHPVTLVVLLVIVALLEDTIPPVQENHPGREYVSL